jgi:pimeloyl-ACP methyl ester carboxylesterase
MLFNPDSLRGNFGRSPERQASVVGEAAQAVADDVQGVVISGVGHFVAEEAPDEMLAALTEFLARTRRPGRGT